MAIRPAEPGPHERLQRSQEVGGGGPRARDPWCPVPEPRSLTPLSPGTVRRALSPNPGAWGSLGKPRLWREWTRSVRVRTQAALGARRALPNGDTAPSRRTVTRKNSERLVDADNSAVIAGGRQAYRD